MIVVIVGTEYTLLDTKTKECIQKHNLDAQAFVYQDIPTIDILRESAFAQDLFGEQKMYIVRDMYEDVYDFVFSNIDTFVHSKNIFIVQVSKVLKKQKDICEKAGVELIQTAVPQERKTSSFVLADAFLRRDKKAAFSALFDELATKQPEEVHGGLWYQIKNMTLIFTGANEQEAGLHPFVYKKLQTASRQFSKEECHAMMGSLIAMNHKAHQGELDFEAALEEFVLRYVEKTVTTGNLRQNVA